MSDHQPVTDQRSSTGAARAEGVPLVVVAGHAAHSQWLLRLLEGAGYAVLLERSARHAYERARAAQPDLLVVAADLPDMAGVELCEVVARDARVLSGTPVFFLFDEPATRAQRVAALRAGAWECIAPPHDQDEILLKAGIYTRAKRQAERACSKGLLEPETGIYNRQGLVRRASEISSQAFREHAALACVVLALDLGRRPLVAPDEAAEAVGRGARTLLSTARRSDAIGRLGPTEFAVIAPGTDAAGALRLAERLAGSLEVALAPRPAAGPPAPGVRFGYEAVANVGYAPIEPAELLRRAAAALRTGKAEPGGRIRRFEALGAPSAPAAPPP